VAQSAQGIKLDDRLRLWWLQGNVPRSIQARRK